MNCGQEIVHKQTYRQTDIQILKITMTSSAKASEYQIGCSNYGCERTGSDNASDKRQNCHLSCRVKLSFRKINGNRRKCTHRTRATSDKIFQATTDKILYFYNFMRALLRQATILSLVARVVAPCAFTPLLFICCVQVVI